MASLVGYSQIVAYRPGHKAHIVTASATGLYDLDARERQVPVCTTVLLKGDSIGFTHDSQGKLLAAVAEAERHQLREAKYHWRFRSNPDPAGVQINPGERLAWLAPQSLEAVTLGAIEWGLSEADRHLDKLEEQGLTRYQKKALRRSHAEDEDP